MIHMLRTLTLTLLFALISPVIIHAQGSLEKVVKNIENSSTGIVSTMYREQRDPLSHKVINSEMIIVFDKKEYMQSIVEAMKKERGNSVDYTVDSGPRNATYRISFIDRRGASSSYMLHSNGPSQWTLAVKTSIKTAKRTNTQKR